MIDIEGGAQRVAFMRACCGALAQTEEAIHELFSIIREYGADPHRAGALQGAQEAPGIGRCLAVVDPDNNPTRCPVDGHEEGTAAALICHRWQVFQVDGDGTGFIGFEGAVLWPGRCCFQGAQGPHAMPTQAAVKARAGGIRVQELAHHRQQIIQRDQKRLAEGHGDSFLRWRQRRLKAMGRVAAILHAGTISIRSVPWSRDARQEPTQGRHWPVWPP